MIRAAATALSVCMVVTACGDDDDACGATWTDVLEDRDDDDHDLGAVILSVWGPSRDDLVFAGGTLGVEPRRGVLLHFDGDRWEDLPVDVAPTLWWTTRTPEGTVWAAGEEGLVVRWKDGVFTRFEALADATLFGIWGAADDDVWAVGGAIGEGDRDVILHFDGDAWARVPPPEAFGVQLFKVWGSAADDVFMVGGGGVILHHDGTALTAMESGGRAQLLTVHGTAADDVWAVGAGNTILHYDGDAWSAWSDAAGAETLIGLPTGVFAVPGGDVCIVGNSGGKIRIFPDGTHDEEETFEGTSSDLHSTWCDAEGQQFAVGGNYFETEPEARLGTIAYRGCSISSDGLP